ncbi:GtrA family protein [Nocardia cyriacigeorgica]|uniref:GtrA/DPMS transmembrane domain-containing protein n=1 Tax=Nocardia cyriacigeorgica (strain GUH-2) TaxID=1127134 RepID=H6R378_NOCCG|nr:GtrA family protein [Nocardia cyriacigeorgica]CCF65676.1 conserved membrane protein of unknown function [Nocardia cyriacigeorgica GUH-2]
MNSTAFAPAANPAFASMTRSEWADRSGRQRADDSGARLGGSRVRQALLSAHLDRLSGSRIRQALLGTHPCAQLLRFALVGGASNLSYLLLFLACAGFGPLAANAAGSIVSTMIANELHRRITFGAAGRVGCLTAQWQGGGLALIGLLTSTAALSALDLMAPGLGEFTRAGAVLTIMAAVGGLRFLALRGLF